MATRITRRVRRKTVPATQEVVQERTTVTKKPTTTVVHKPATLAEALASPAIVVPETEEAPEQEVVTEVVRKKKVT